MYVIVWAMYVWGPAITYYNQLIDTYYNGGANRKFKKKPKGGPLEIEFFCWPVAATHLSWASFYGLRHKAVDCRPAKPSALIFDWHRRPPLIIGSIISLKNHALGPG